MNENVMYPFRVPSDVVCMHSLCLPKTPVTHVDVVCEPVPKASAIVELCPVTKVNAGSM